MRRTKIVIALFVIAIICGSGCDSLSGCGAGEMRCHNNAAQMCNANGEWENWQNCSSIGETCGNGEGYCYGYDVACCY